MKARLFDSSGAEKGQIELPDFFGKTIREDIAQKFFEVEKYDLRQPYAPYDEAGKRHSASGRIKHIRHKWRTAYGKGISRLPRKTMWRRGTQFYWVGAEVSNARGGRRAHPPKGVFHDRKINKKEAKIAFESGFASTANKDFLLKRYSSLTEVSNVPAVVESLPTKASDMLVILEKIFGKSFSVALKNKVVRDGKGKKRGRRFKSNAGLLIVTGKDEKAKFNLVEIKNVKEINMVDLFPLGRLTLYTKKSLEELKNVM